MYIPVWLLVVAVIILFIMVCKVSSQVSGCGELAVSIINRISTLEKENDSLQAKLTTLSERMEKRFDDESEYLHERISKMFEMQRKHIVFSDRLNSYNFYALHRMQFTINQIALTCPSRRVDYEDVKSDAEHDRKQSAEDSAILFECWNDPKRMDTNPLDIHKIIDQINDDTFSYYKFD